MSARVIDYIGRVERWTDEGRELGECSWCGRAGLTDPRDPFGLQHGRAFGSVATEKGAGWRKTKTTCDGMFRFCRECEPRARRFEGMAMRAEFPPSDVPLMTAYTPNGEPMRFRDGDAAGKYLREAAKHVPKAKRKPKPKARKVPKAAPKAKPAPKPRAPRKRRRGEHSGADVFRMYRRDLEALGTPEALAEIERRKAKRAAKAAA